MFEIVALLAGMLIFGLLAVLTWPRASHIPRLGAAFQRETRTWVCPEDIAMVDAVVMAGRWTLSVGLAAGTLLLPVVALWTDSASALAAPLLGVVVAMLLKGELQLRELGRLEAGYGAPVKASDFLGPFRRWSLGLVPVAAVVLWRQPTQLQWVLLGAALICVAVVISTQRRRLWRLRFMPRDQAQGYVLDALRWTVLRNETIVLSTLWPLALTVDAWTEPAPTVVVFLLTITVIGNGSDEYGTPRFRKRRWPDLRPGEVLVGDAVHPPRVPAA